MIKLTKIKFEGERQRYTVTARNNRFVIMTKPFNARKTYLYTIADLDQRVRGPCNLIFGPPCDLSTQSGAEDALAMLASGEMSVSHRRRLELRPSEYAALAEQEADNAQH